MQKIRIYIHKNTVKTITCGPYKSKNLPAAAVAETAMLVLYEQCGSTCRAAEKCKRKNLLLLIMNYENKL